MKKLNYFLTIFILSCSSFCMPFLVQATPIDESNTIKYQSEQNTLININTASAEELAKILDGIGLSKAKKIVEYRDKFGPFVTIEQLKEVAGIGQSILDKNISKISL